MATSIALMDCNNFYASCERLLQPDLRGRPVGVVGRMAARRQKLGIGSPLALRDAEPTWVRQKFGVVMQRMVLELRAIPCIALSEHPADNKCIITSRSFGRAVTTLREFGGGGVYARRAGGAADAAPEAHGGRGERVHEHDRFNDCDRQYSGPLSVAIADTARFLRVATHLVRKLWREGYRYKKAGVMLLARFGSERAGEPVCGSG